MNNPTSSPSVVPFRFESSDVRTMTIDGEPWFVAKDVCDVLGVANPTQAIEQLDDDEKAIQNIGYSGPGNPNVNIISESGLYTLIIRSNKPQAKPFRKWVTAEVMPAIRKTGCYQAQQQEAVGSDGFHTFSFSGHDITVFADADGSLWFRAMDITRALGYANLGQVPHKLCDPRGRRHITCRKSNGSKGTMVFIDEANLFRLLIRSSKSGTEEMQRFFADTVLPALRVSGHRQMVPGGEVKAVAPPEGVAAAPSSPPWELERRRFLATFDREGRMRMEEIEDDCYIFPVYRIPIILEKIYLEEKERAALPRIIEAAIKRMMREQ